MIMVSVALAVIIVVVVVVVQRLFPLHIFTTFSQLNTALDEDNLHDNNIS